MVEMGPDRRRLETGTPWEERMGYSRAVQAGPLLSVAGCVGVMPDGSYPEDLGSQTLLALERVESALGAFDAGLEQVVKLRIYTTRLDDWEQIAAVLGPALEDVRPANLLVGVERLVDEALIELEAEAWLG